LPTLALRTYKKYVSGHLGVRCNYTPSCSQYTHQAIAHHGLLEGSKYGAMRWISCDGSHSTCSTHSSPQQAPVSLIQPPTLHASSTRRVLTQAAASCAQLAGRVLGALGGGVMGAALGLVVGGQVGYKAGNGTLPAWNQQILTKYQPSSPAKFLEIESRLASPALNLRHFLLEKTDHEGWTNQLAATYGALSGALLGAVGGALAIGRMGSKFAGLAAQNATRDLLSQLPRDPYQEDLLQREFR
jgi:putative component of membrane protein insertase Oxa1/YidC/SpoIIIJ protein YidD